MTVRMTAPTETRRRPVRSARTVGPQSAASVFDGVDRAVPVERRAERFGTAFPEVLAAAQAGGPWAYQRLFDWLARPVAGYLRGQGAEDPDGLANDVFLRAFTNIGGFTGDEDRFRSWVFTIAHNGLVDERRRRSRRPVVDDRPVEERTAPDDTEAAALDRVGDERVRSLLAELSAEQRDVLLLRIVADLTVEQVAGTMGKTPGAVKQLQRRGLAVLRQRLEDEAAASSSSGTAAGRRTPAGSSGGHRSG